MSVAADIWTADDGSVTADSTKYTADGGIDENSMPAVVGLQYYKALDVLIASGLQPLAPILTHVTGYRRGFVVSQSIPIGDPISPRMPVTLTVEHPQGNQFLAANIGKPIPYWYFYQRSPNPPNSWTADDDSVTADSTQYTADGS